MNQLCTLIDIPLLNLLRSQLPRNQLHRLGPRVHLIKTEIKKGTAKVRLKVENRELKTQGI